MVQSAMGAMKFCALGWYAARVYIAFEKTRFFAKFARPSNMDYGLSAVCVQSLYYGIRCSEMVYSVQNECYIQFEILCTFIDTRRI